MISTKRNWFFDGALIFSMILIVLLTLQIIKISLDQIYSTKTPYAHCFFQNITNDIEYNYLCVNNLGIDYEYQIKTFDYQENNNNNTDILIFKCNNKNQFDQVDCDISITISLVYLLLGFVLFLISLALFFVTLKTIICNKKENDK
jgi:hypothetical protein